MLLIAFICFASLIVGWLVAPTAAPRMVAEPEKAGGVPEHGTSLA